MAIPQGNKRKARSSPGRKIQLPEPPHNPDVASSSSSSVPQNLIFPSIETFVLPPGYKFAPTDEELIVHYLNPFAQGNKDALHNVPIHQVNIYESNPQQLSEIYAKANEKEWLFVSPRKQIVCKGGGKRQKRSDDGGYWHVCVACQKIYMGNRLVYYKTCLEYYNGKQPNGTKGDYLMQEFCLENNNENQALCKIYLTPKAAKIKKKSEEEEKEKLLKEEAALAVEVWQLAFSDPVQEVVLEEDQPQPQLYSDSVPVQEEDQVDEDLLRKISEEEEKEKLLKEEAALAVEVWQLAFSDPVQEVVLEEDQPQPQLYSDSVPVQEEDQVDEDFWRNFMASPLDGSSLWLVPS